MVQTEPLRPPVPHGDQKACRGRPEGEQGSTGTSLSRSLRGIPNRALRHNKSPRELQPAGREGGASDGVKATSANASIG